MAYEFKLPDIGEGLTEGEVVTWLVKEGETVKDDQPMVEVMTDKATVEITAPTAGVIAEIRAQEGETVPVGSIMVVIDDGKGELPPRAAPAAEASKPSTTGPSASKPSAPSAAAPPAPAQPVGAVAARTRTLAAPATRKLAREHGVDLNVVPATGPHGRVLRRDVLAFAEHGAAARPAAAAGAGAPAPAYTTRERIVLPSVAAAREDQGRPVARSAGQDRRADGAFEADVAPLHLCRRSGHDAPLGAAQGS